jgi:hypothetical protein
MSRPPCLEDCELITRIAHAVAQRLVRCLI